MNTVNLIKRTAAVTFVVLVVATGFRVFQPETTTSRQQVVIPDVVSETAVTPSHPSFLHGRVTTIDGDVYQGRIRFGGDEEAFWGNYFNGYKDHNPWASYVSEGELSGEERTLNLFGLKISRASRPLDLGRPFMARFGNIERIEAFGENVRLSREDGIDYDPDVRVTLKSGTTFDLDRLSFGDFDDGVRVWDDTHGVMDIGTRRIRSIQFEESKAEGSAPNRLYGTVRTLGGDFTGFLQWDREQTLAGDELVGYADGARTSTRFKDVRAIIRRTENSALVLLSGGDEVVLSDARGVGRGNRGVYVDDARYGRVLVSWDAFQRVDLEAAPEGPSYDDYAAGHALAGTVRTRDGRRLTGQLVYDLDESETYETLDAPWEGVDYTIPFGEVAIIALQSRKSVGVVLRSGEVIELERAGDLGEGNAGILVFTAGNLAPAYVAWADVVQIDFDDLSAG